MHAFAMPLMESERIMMLKNSNGGLELSELQYRDNMIPSSYLFDQTSLSRGLIDYYCVFPMTMGVFGLMARLA